MWRWVFLIVIICDSKDFFEAKTITNPVCYKGIRFVITIAIINPVCQKGSNMISLGKPRLLLLLLFPFLQPSWVHLTFQHQVSLERGMWWKHLCRCKIVYLLYFVFCVGVFCKICHSLKCTGTLFCDLKVKEASMKWIEIQFLQLHYILYSI